MTDNQFHKSVDEGKTQEPAVEPTEHETRDKTEEKSDFLLQWQKRHEAYLAQRNQKGTVPEQGKGKNEPTIAQEQIIDTPTRLENATFSPDAETRDQEIILVEQEPIPKMAILRSFPIFLFFTILMLSSLYFISPYSKEKDIEVTGLRYTDANSIIKSSLIADEDYILTTLLNHSAYENNIKQSYIWVKDVRMTFQIPNHFNINVEEYDRIGFFKQDESYYSLYSNGEMMKEMTPPTEYMNIQLTDQALIEKLASELAMVDSVVVSAIQDIQLTPSNATSDLLTLTMADGNTVLVPLSEISMKLPYYSKIVGQLQVVSTIDMEVGIFSYASEWLG